MAKIRVQDGNLIVEMEGLGEKLMALRSELKLPVEHITGVRANPPELLDETFIARVFGASLSETHIGYFWKKGDGMVFIDIDHLHGKNKIVAIDLRDERLKHLYVEPSDETSVEAQSRLEGELKLKPAN